MVTYKQNNIYHLESKTSDDPTQVPSLSVGLSLIKQSSDSDTETISCTLACPVSYPSLPEFLPHLLGLNSLLTKKTKTKPSKTKKKKILGTFFTGKGIIAKVIILWMKIWGRNFHFWRQEPFTNAIQHSSQGPHATSWALECGIRMDCKCETPTPLWRPNSKECDHLNNFVLIMCCNAFDILSSWKWIIKIHFFNVLHVNTRKFVTYVDCVCRYLNSAVQHCPRVLIPNCVVWD